MKDGFRAPGLSTPITLASRHPLPQELPFPWPDAMQAQLPEVKAATDLEPYRMTVAAGGRQFLDHVDVVSPNFSKLYDFRW
jgi:hypothetical protein